MRWREEHKQDDNGRETRGEGARGMRCGESTDGERERNNHSGRERNKNKMKKREEQETCKGRKWGETNTGRWREREEQAT